jgi:CheY-like chemotaxis protein
VAKRETLLLIDTGANPMEESSRRLRELGYRVLRTKTVEQGHAALSDARFAVRLALIPPDLPVPDLARALAALRAPGAKKPVRFLVTGARPDADERSALRRAGLELALWEPFDDHTLQFQVNRALINAGSAPRKRRSERVPTSWPVRVTAGRREKQAKIYCVSADGAFLATSRPSLPKARVHFSLPLPSGDVRLSGEVVMTNVPGNLVRKNLPVGMGVRFAGYSRQIEQAILAFTEERGRALRV